MSAQRRAWGVAIGGALLLLLNACGAATKTVGSATAATTATAGGRQKVTYGRASMQVPAAWPVYDLAAAPHRCARFDVHAVYLGHQAADAACPARALGKTEAVQIEADDDYARARVLPAPSGAAPASVNGLTVTYEPGGAANHNLVATYPGLGVVVRATYGTDQALAQEILASATSAGS